MALRSTRHVLAIVLATLLPLGGCLTDLGECDQGAAHRVVFRDNGSKTDPANGHPMYAGQAILAQSCGNGQFCHSEYAHAERRYGVPHALNFDFGLVCTGGPCLPFEPGLGPLHRAQSDALTYARHILQAARYGSMPPGAVGADIASRGPDYRIFEYTPGTTYSLEGFEVPCSDMMPGDICNPETMTAIRPWPRMERVGTHEGNEILRNWLACGAPVIESTGDPGQLATGGDCSIPGEVGHVGDCVVRVPAPIDPPEPYFECIYDALITQNCRSCHTPSDNVNFPLSLLDFSTEQAAYRALVGDPGSPSFAGGRECQAAGQQLVVPGAGGAEQSLLYLKLIRDPDVCGDPMPTGTSAVDSRVTDRIRAWIEAGAPELDPNPIREDACKHPVTP